MDNLALILLVIDEQRELALFASVLQQPPNTRDRFSGAYVPDKPRIFQFNEYVFALLVI